MNIDFDSSTWLHDLSQQAELAQRKGGMSRDPMKLARRADDISTEIGELTARFNRNPATRNLPLAFEEAVRGAEPDMQIYRVRGHDTQRQLAELSQDLRALSNAYRESGCLLRDLAKPGADKTAMTARASYWLKELHNYKGALHKSTVALENISTALHDSVTSHYIGSDPQEQRERSNEIADGIEALRNVNKDDLRAYVRQSARRLSQSPMALATQLLYDTIATTRQVERDSNVIKTADEIAMLTAHCITSDAPGTAPKRV